MTQRYVWFDDVDARKLVRTEVRLPKPLRDFALEVAERHQVSLTAFLVGLLSYAADANAHKRLKIEVVPGVRIREAGPDDKLAFKVLDMPDRPAFRKRRYGLADVRGVRPK